jgi:NADH:ubiquinone oxidoreductase subunit 5 (subunit L)/multisubunit Na+/H+ antiporter MnhA subunit/multisubunit Na+/H+ antiporter MnhB subunit
MADVFVPIVLCVAGAALAGLFTLTPLGRRIPSQVMGWLLALAPAAAFILLLQQVPALIAGEKFTNSFVWLPTLGIQVSFWLDGLSALFALLVSGIGTLILIYAGYYFAHGDAHENTDSRFFFYILLFMASMLGLVLAGDVITLFLFWEGTSVTSFLLVAYKTKDEAARKGAFKALFITGGGGIALLAGLLFVSAVAGSTDFATILTSGDVLRGSVWYPVMFGLVALGAFTKSAQVPAHIWLPNAMSAPTPASAFLHSATMVKAGIYLMARMFPALGGTDLWFWTLVGFGAVTMLVGAIIGMKQTDLKAVLAYSTISQLGVLMFLIGQSDAAAFKALVIGVIAHAFYKGGLFLIAGIVDHSTGTRDLRRLGSIWKMMPFSFVIAAIVGMSAAGLPPLLGFLSKETLLADVLDHPEPGLWAVILPAAIVIMGAFMLAEAAVLVLDTFVTKPGAGFPKAYIDMPLTGEGKDDPEDVEEIDTHKPAHAYHDETLHAHEAPMGMLIGPAVLAVLSIVFTVAPFAGTSDFLAKAAGAAYGAPVKVSLALFHGINLPLILSIIAITLGIVLFIARSAVRGALFRLDERLSINRVYDAALAGIDKLAFWATRTQAGRVRHYLMVMIIAILALLALFGGVPQVLAAALSPANLAKEIETIASLQNGLRVVSLMLAVAASFVSVIIKRDLFAILALGASGLAMALLIALEPSPDVALVQVIVDILSTVVLVLALTRLPRAQRERAEQFNHARRVTNVPRDVLLSAGMGAVVAVICLYAFISRPRESIVTPFYEENSKPLTGAADIVGAIVVDFRGFDTMIEITVFSMAGAGVYTLLRHTMKKRETAQLEAKNQADGIAEEAIETNDPAHGTLPEWIKGIGSLRTSSFVHMLAYIALPLALVVACVHMIYGHDQPGDGFTAGVIISLAVGLWYVVFGYDDAKQRLGALKPSLLIGAGIMTVMLGSIAPVFLGGTFFSPFDFGAAMGLPLPAGFYLSTSFLFEIAICLSVLGSATFILDTLGHPERDLE